MSRVPLPSSDMPGWGSSKLSYSMLVFLPCSNGQTVENDELCLAAADYKTSASIEKTKLSRKEFLKRGAIVHSSSSCHVWTVKSFCMISAEIGVTHECENYGIIIARPPVTLMNIEIHDHCQQVKQID